MDLFLLLSEFQSNNVFYKMSLSFTNDSKTGFENRKWNYFSYFQSLTKQCCQAQLQLQLQLGEGPKKKTTNFRHICPNCRYPQAKLFPNEKFGKKNCGRLVDREVHNIL